MLNLLMLCPDAGKAIRAAFDPALDGDRIWQSITVNLALKPGDTAYPVRVLAQGRAGTVDDLDVVYVQSSPQIKALFQPIAFPFILTGDKLTSQHLGVSPSVLAEWNSSADAALANSPMESAT